MNIINVLLSNKNHNKHYLNRYIKFIKWCQLKNSKLIKKSNKNPNGVYMESHHICPKSMFPKYKSKKENNWNIIELTARQHFISHWILWKAYDNDYMRKAFYGMIKWNIKNSKRYFKLNSKAYQILKEKISETHSKRMTGRVPSDKERNLASIRMKNRIVTDETRRNMSNAFYTNANRRNIAIANLPKNVSGVNNPFFGKSHSKETKDRMSKLYKGISQEERHGKEEAQRIKKLQASTTGKKWWTNGEKEVLSFVSPDESFIAGRKNSKNIVQFSIYVDFWRIDKSISQRT